MAEIKKYVTLRKEASAEFEEKRSVFIGYAKPVKTEAEAMEFVKASRGKHDRNGEDGPADCLLCV